jgi:4a-hydroxytetrahydrobiopterin dehydratase
MIKVWDKNEAQLSVVFEFDRFVKATAFVQECAEEMERQNHHASIQWEYCTVKMQLTTHDEGNTLTSKDSDLSEAISLIYEKGY